MLINCSFCRKEMDVKPSRIKRCKEISCSRDCADKLKIGKKKDKEHNHNCGYCKKSFYVPEHKLKALKDGIFKNLFCQKDCLQKWQSENFSKEQPKTNCFYCNKEYHTSDYRLRIRERSFCSYECKNKQRNLDGTSIAKCYNCGIGFRRKKSQLNRDKTFCSRGCMDTFNSSEEAVDFYIEMHNKAMKKAKLSDTIPEVITQGILEDMDIEYIKQFRVHRFVSDFYLPEYNLLVEVFGDYWHGNPKKFKESELNETQIEMKKRDKRKVEFYKLKNFNLLIFWESDLKEDKKKIENELTEELNRIRNE